ncbi:MAG: hypothetical protein AAGA69_03595 [Pseudomonadota bacterium]
MSDDYCEPGDVECEQRQKAQKQRSLIAKAFSLVISGAVLFIIFFFIAQWGLSLETDLEGNALIASAALISAILTLLFLASRTIRELFDIILLSWWAGSSLS